MRPKPVHRASCLASSWVLRLHVGAPAVGRPPASQRRLAGCQRMGRPRMGRHRLGRVGRRWRRGWIGRPLGPSPRPVCPWVLAPHCDACGPRLRGASACAVAPGLPTQRHHTPPLPPLPIGQERPSARRRAALAQATQGVVPSRAVVPAPGPRPTTSGARAPSPRSSSLGPPLEAKAGGRVETAQRLRAAVGKTAGDRPPPAAVLYATAALWPAREAVVAHVLEACRRVEASPCGAGCTHWPKERHGGVHIGAGWMLCRCNSSATGGAMSDGTWLSLGDGLVAIACHVLPTPRGPSHVRACPVLPLT